MTTVNLLDQIIQPGDDRRRRRCMNESGWIAFSTGRDQQLPRRTRVSCRAHQRRPLVPSAAGEARAGHARAATARARTRAAPLPAHAGWSQVAAVCGRRARSPGPKMFLFGSGIRKRTQIMSCAIVFVCRGIELGCSDPCGYIRISEKRWTQKNDHF